jgi:hypothetical protein
LKIWRKSSVLEQVVITAAVAAAFAAACVYAIALSRHYNIPSAIWPAPFARPCAWR